MDNPMEQLTTLMQRVNEVVTELGLDLETFAILPNMDPRMPGQVQVILRLDPERAFTTPEQRAVDEQFKEIAIHEHAEQVRERIEQARREAIESLKEDLDDGTGIGLD